MRVALVHYGATLLSQHEVHVLLREILVMINWGFYYSGKVDTSWFVVRSSEKELRSVYKSLKWEDPKLLIFFFVKI